MTRLLVALLMPTAGKAASIRQVLHAGGLTISASIHMRILLLLHLAGRERAAEDQP
jgi:hypothetical protein